MKLGILISELPIMSEPKVLVEATFDPKVKTYWTWQPIFIFSIIIVTIPIAIIYYFVSRFFIDKYLENLSCTLTERTLDIKKGIFNKTESTIPLEKITDLQLFQGPIMRYFGLFGFKVETAGQSTAGAGSLVNIVGITETKAFRKAVLQQRDVMGSGRSNQSPMISHGEMESPQSAQVLIEIRDALHRIEGRLGSQSDS